MLYNVTRQAEALASATRVGLEEFNIQLQGIVNMALQNRVTFDLLTCHENGVCGYLNLANNTQCIHIVNVTQDLDEQLDSRRHAAKVRRDLRESMEGGGLN